MLSITIKNVFKNKLLYLCLTAGFIFSIAIVCAVPTYIDSVLNNYISSIFSQAENKPLQENKKYIPPSAAYLSVGFKSGIDYETFNQGYGSFKSMFLTEAKKVPVPTLAEKVYLTFDSIRYTYTKDNKSYDSINNKLGSISDFNSHIDIVSGRLPSKDISAESAVEVIVDKKTFDNFKLELDKTYEILHIENGANPKMKVVGIFQTKDAKESYWLDKDTNFYCKFMTEEEALIKLFQSHKGLGKFLKGLTFEIIYDYTKITNKNATAIYKTAADIESSFIKRTGSDINFQIAESLKAYAANERLYSVVMWIFLIPIMLVVMYYIWMISELIVDSDKEQIAVLKSRGASQFQILRQYLYEGLLLSSVGMLFGPLLGIALCKAISYSDGFLVFNSLQGIKITTSSKVYIYALITVIGLLATLLISVFFAAQKSIVEVRQSKNRYLNMLIKNKYMDLILLAVALYGYYNYNVNKNIPSLTGIKTDRPPLDPLLYFLSTIFIVGVGLFMLRIYKYIMKLIFKLGKNKYFTALYVSIINVMRYHLKKSTAMLFIIITTAIAIFNMHIAKDINTSYINTVKYPTGTDIIIKGQWDKVTYEVDEEDVKALPNTKSKDTSQVSAYIEPSYNQYSKIEGIEAYTKVFRDEEGQASLNSNINNKTTIMGIIPHEFGGAAYFDSSLLKTHWYNYLNKMTQKTNYILVSRNLSSSAGIKTGDTVYYNAKGSLMLKGTVLDVIDYWPGLSDMQNQNILIANFNYIFSKIQMKPYEVWLKKKPEVSNQFVYNSIKNNNIAIAELKDLTIETFKAKSDIFLKGTNSVLNLGFLSIGAITVLGFLVYWVLSLKARTLSFGIYRSLGISSKVVTLILILEQFFTLGASILAGVIAGNLAGNMFIPLIKKLWYENKYVIPARNLHYIMEYLQLGAVFTLVFIASFVVLARYMRKLKVNQAVKLGED
ncbi:FtsX-like permease family protein [Clostridium swellfunianum]|uniref:ABC transporter permease n=1 Tax=Clostridium swellfunianum TaxID=1367462 RepID=UPI00202F1C98|nr:FtsX-like permease family protein [Clostridium swellfunianum]MCM0649372.1 FtsX-like permease family protein [Clostridium swellfunianum]